MIRPLPRNPLLVLFTRDPRSLQRSIVAITIDDDTRPSPQRCYCQTSPDCRITALERRRGTSSTLRAQRLDNNQPDSPGRWDLLPLTARGNDWKGLLRISIWFPTVKARHFFGGTYCECNTATEGDVDACLSNQHQGLLGIVRVYYRRQMVIWQEQRDKQKEVDGRSGKMRWLLPAERRWSR